MDDSPWKVWIGMSLRTYNPGLKRVCLVTQFASRSRTCMRTYLLGSNTVQLSTDWRRFCMKENCACKIRKGLNLENLWDIFFVGKRPDLQVGQEGSDSIPDWCYPQRLSRCCTGALKDFCQNWIGNCTSVDQAVGMSYSLGDIVC